MTVAVRNSVAVGNTIPVCSCFLALRRLLVIRLNVELDEQKQVAAEDAATEQCGSLCPSAVANVWEIREVCVDVVLIGPKIHCEQINDKLDNLHGREVLFPPNFGTASCRVIVVVHNNVDCQIQRDDHPLNTGFPF